MLRDVCGLQAQLLSAAALGIRARTTGLRSADITYALNEERSIVRSWLMRGTLHMIATEDLGMLLGLLGPVFAAGNQARHARLGLDEDLKRRGVTAIHGILSRAGPLTATRSSTVCSVAASSSTERRRRPSTSSRSRRWRASSALVPTVKIGEPTYVLIDDWVQRPRSRSRPAALGELARRYVAAYGPAGLEDLVAWSGLPVAQARSAIAVTLPAKTVRLLPAFDTYLLGYHSRELAVPAPLERRLQRGGGWRHPAVVVDGRAVGAWSLRKTGGRTQLAIETVEPIIGALMEGVETEVADISRFLNTEVTLVSTRLAPNPA